jgi:excisionase family DNA binding protein
MSQKDKIVRLKRMHIRNAEIARLLKVSRQYVSRVCRTADGLNKISAKPDNEEFVTTGRASRLLGVSQATMRRWGDEGKIPSIRINIGRRDRRFSISDLKQLKLRIGTDQSKTS